MKYLVWIDRFNACVTFPAALLFLSIAILLTVLFGLVQLRSIKRFFHLVFYGFEQQNEYHTSATISGFHALFTAMATAIGTGSIVAPSLAIIAGGPGALFWLIVYLFFGSVLKYTEVILGMRTRTIGKDNMVLGGPINYLSLIHPWLGVWYGFVMLLLYFFGWQTVQANTLAAVFAQEAVHPLMIGVPLGLLLYLILQGGALLVGRVASYLVPVMFFLYVIFAVIILGKNMVLVGAACKLVLREAFSLRACVESVCGFGFLPALQAGVYRGIFISEAGLGTTSIPHAVSNARYPQDQAILALYSTIADIVLSIISGLLILVTGVWVGQNSLKATLIYEAFKQESPGFGQYVLLISITLFVFTTILGNGFNGMQIYKHFMSARHTKLYVLFVSAIVCSATLLPVPIVWQVQDFLLTLAIIPHICGLLWLAVKNRSWFI